MGLRTYAGIIATLVLLAGGVGLAYQLDQGNLTLGEDSDVSATVSGNPDSFEFDAERGAEITVTVTDTGESPYRGAVTVVNPDGADVLNTGPRSSEMSMRTITAERGGTFELVVNPQSTQLKVNVLVEDPSD